MTTFQALVLEAEGEVAALRRLDAGALDEAAEGEVLVAVSHSSLNYKDALALVGRPGIVRHYPMVPGIDLAGEVLVSSVADYPVGAQVLATGQGLGERRWGGYSERARLPAAMLTLVPPGRDARWAMRVGTAGLTAMLCVMALEDAGLRPAAGAVAVSGAGGGVGGVAVALLAALGYEVTALSGRHSALGDYLRGLGATALLSREEAEAPSGPLEKQRWAGAVDTVGGLVLARLLAQTNYGGAVAACGLAGATAWPGNVMPFILRSVRLQGVDTVSCSAELRRTAWHRLASELPDAALDAIASEELALADVSGRAAALLAGEQRGRLSVRVGG